jgi:hypothetical protein
MKAGWKEIEQIKYYNYCHDTELRASQNGNIVIFCCFSPKVGGGSGSGNGGVGGKCVIKKVFILHHQLRISEGQASERRTEKMKIK